MAANSVAAAAKRCGRFCLAIAISAGWLVGPGSGVTPTDPGPGDVAFSINAGGGSPISPLIYGVNGGLRPSGVAGIRLGGNRWTGYNWETNNSNAGEDYFHASDQFLTGAYGQTTPPGQAVLPTLQEADALGAATLVTVPMAGYVSADQNGTVTAAETAPSSRWKQLVTRKEGVYPGAALSTSPNLSDDYVFADEFVHWVESNRQNNQPVGYLLDNEPSLWDNTHPHLFGSAGPTFAEVGQKSIATAAAIKDAAPGAPVLGGVTFGWSGAQNLQDAPDFLAQVASDGGRQPDKLQFNRWLLKEFAAAEQQQGRVLMDALDLHWYPEARGGGVRITAGGEANTSPAVVEARVQAPRSLWDPDYIEDSWITEFVLKDDSGQGADQGVELLNRVRDDIAELKPGTRISVSEYNYGGGAHISGGIAQADVLGVFGREGVWNASWWPIEDPANAAFTKAGFEMFTDFDGRGGRFGDLSLNAATDDNAQSSVYASRSTDNPGELIIVAINRTGGPLDAAIQIAGEQRYTSAEVYQLTDAAAEPVFVETVPIAGLNALLYAMPAYSVSTLRLGSEGLAGDFNGDGAVTAADYTIWRDTYGQTGSGLAADVDGDNAVTATDWRVWKEAFEAANTPAANTTAADTQAAATPIPEPATLALAAAGCLLAWGLRKRPVADAPRRSA